MPIPQVTDRIKEAPALALRALFAGIGQLLLAADKVRTRAVDQLAQLDRARSGSAQARPAASSTVTPSAPAAPPPTTPSASRAPTAPPRPPAPGTAPSASPASTPPSAPEQASDASLAGASGGESPGGKPAAGKRPATKPRATAKPTNGKRPGSKPRAPGKPAPTALPARKPPAPVQPASEAPPLPNYDDLPVASLRARLRVLDAGTLRAMIAYEKAHANREAVITMFERRLAKMGGEES